MADSKQLAALVAKQAGLLCLDDAPNSNPDLQAMVGDPDDARTSAFAQFAPNPGDMSLPNPLSPIEGDQIFYAYLIPGAVFQSHDGHQYTILDYPWQNMVHIQDRWYPVISPMVSVYDVRRSIDQWVEPIQQTVPPPPPGVDYGAMLVKIVDGETNIGRPDELAGNIKPEMGIGANTSSGW